MQCIYNGPSEHPERLGMRGISVGTHGLLVPEWLGLLNPSEAGSCEALWIVWIAEAGAACSMEDALERKAWSRLTAGFLSRRHDLHASGDATWLHSTTTDLIDCDVQVRRMHELALIAWDHLLAGRAGELEIRWRELTPWAAPAPAALTGSMAVDLALDRSDYYQVP